MQLAVGVALEDPSRSSPEFAATAVEWAQSAAATRSNEGEGADEERMREQAVVAAATTAMRDGDPELRPGMKHGHGRLLLGCVTVLDDGFDFHGERFRSMSEIARKITGARWSGPLFFGLKSFTREVRHRAE